MNDCLLKVRLARSAALLALWVIPCAQMSVSCKEPQGGRSRSFPGEERLRDADSGDIDALRLASARRELYRSADFYFRIWNQTYEVNLDSLPKSAEIPDGKKPWSGSWYPERNQGVNTGGALDRYDEIFHGGQPLAKDWEQQNHTRAANDPFAGWAGHCNGWAAAAQRHTEPKNPVKRKIGQAEVEFSRNDIKALLAEIHMSVQSVFIGGSRCGTDEAPCLAAKPEDRSDPTSLSPYEDVNPASFHVALANWIGRQNHIVLFDEKNDEQVWNYPLYAYDATITPLASASAAAALIVPGRTSYNFNPEATQFVRVRMKVTYANVTTEESNHAFPFLNPKTAEYEYVLELNQHKEIIGGEWLRNYQNNHPDFVWVALETQENILRDRRLANPFVNRQEVLKLWAESVGADLNNLPGITEPSFDSDWGRYPEFEVELDGNKSGAVFLDKAIQLKLKRSGRLAEALKIELGLNGRIIHRQDLEAGSAFEFELPELRAGVQQLAFIWHLGETEPYVVFLRFYVMP